MCTNEVCFASPFESIFHRLLLFLPQRQVHTYAVDLEMFFSFIPTGRTVVQRTINWELNTVAEWSKKWLVIVAPE